MLSLQLSDAADNVQQLLTHINFVTEKEKLLLRKIDDAVVKEKHLLKLIADAADKTKTCEKKNDEKQKEIQKLLDAAVEQAKQLKFKLSEGRLLLISYVYLRAGLF